MIPSGTRLNVRVDKAIDTRRNRPGDRFSGYPVAARGGERADPAAGRNALPRTRHYGGVFRQIERPRGPGAHFGRVPAARARVPDRYDQRQPRQRAHKHRNAALIGGGAAVGAAIGAIAGGGKGAAIGVLAGAGAGTAGAAATGKKEVTIAAETPMVFLVRGAVRL